MIAAAIDGPEFLTTGISADLGRGSLKSRPRAWRVVRLSIGQRADTYRQWVGDSHPQNPMVNQSKL
jgi:hypothetical protein